MTWLSLTDDDLQAYRTCTKKITRFNHNWSIRRCNRQRNHEAESESATGLEFLIYQRENLIDRHDFSCGIHLIGAGGRLLCLKRYNGSNHRHGEILFHCHIHIETMEAIQQGKEPEYYAKRSSRFSTADEAFACLILDCGLQDYFTQKGEDMFYEGRRTNT